MGVLQETSGLSYTDLSSLNCVTLWRVTLWLSEQAEIYLLSGQPDLCRVLGLLADAPLLLGENPAGWLFLCPGQPACAFFCLSFNGTINKLPTFKK